MALSAGTGRRSWIRIGSILHNSAGVYMVVWDHTDIRATLEKVRNYNHNPFHTSSCWLMLENMRVFRIHNDHRHLYLYFYIFLVSKFPEIVLASGPPNLGSPLVESMFWKNENGKKSVVVEWCPDQSRSGVPKPWAADQYWSAAC